MNFISAQKAIPLACAVAIGILALAPICRAQMNNQSAGPNLMQETNSAEERMYVGTTDTQADREQATAYESFVKERDLAKKVRLGNDFLQKYPKTPLAERVDVALMNGYREQQDWKNMYLWADNALALRPDNVDILTTVSWTIPHVYNPDDPDAAAELNKAEKYARHALDVIAAMPKPAGMSDADFAKAKAQKSFQAHSALGLVYFRRANYADSARELQLATKGNPTPDPTDLYVLGIDLQNLTRYGDAADAFRACSQMEGPLQSQCKDNAATIAQSSAAKPK